MKIKIINIIAALLLSILSFSLFAEKLIVPDGFKIETFASDVGNARQMALGDKGTVFVGSRRAGKVYALLDSDEDGQSDQKYIIDSGLNMPSGVAFRNGALYVAAVNRILRYSNIEAQLSNPPEPEIIIDDLPTDSHHGWKAIEFNRLGELFIPVGVPCNVCIRDDSRYGSILKLDIQTRQYSIYANGVRNSVGLAFHPENNELWFTDNGRDSMGDDLPPDEINLANRAGLNFGFPYLHGKNILDPVYGKQARPGDYTLPVVELDAHVAPLGLAFYTGNTYPEKYHNGLFVAEHGSWDRSVKSGYRVIHVKLDDTNRSIIEPFVTGWLNRESDSSTGRPVDILVMPDGAMLISDDYADRIYRVTYQQP